MPKSLKPSIIDKEEKVIDSIQKYAIDISEDLSKFNVLSRGTKYIKD